MDRKKRILYVDRNYFPDRHEDDIPLEAFQQHTGLRAYANIQSALGKKYEIDSCLDLNENLLRLLETREKSNKKPDILITHVPFSKQDVGFSFSNLVFYSIKYGKSLEIIEKIKGKYKIPVIAYTGADNIPEVKFLFESFVDAIVFKTRDWENDLKKIEENLERLLGK